MKLAIVTGSRDWTSRTAIWSALDQEQPNIVMHGNCEVRGKDGWFSLRGADRFADEWARKHGCMLVTAPALFDALGKKSGPIRNSFMVKLAAAVLAGWDNKPHQVVVIAAPLGESRGTRDMIAKAEKHQWLVRLVEPDTGEE